MASANDDTWLYGETEGVKPGSTGKQKPDKPADKEAGELSGEDTDKKNTSKTEEDNQQEDSDSDDDVQVTIGDIKLQTYEHPSKFKTGYQRLSSVQASAPVHKSQPKIDLDTPGTINGESTLEFAPDSLEADERPWRKPGADITDYFNYGFNEESWTKYSDRQRTLRMENVGFINKPYMFNPNPAKRQEMTSKPLSVSTADSNTASGEPLSPGQKRSAGPPPQRKSSGTIDVIGGTTYDSRRPVHDFSEADIPSAEAQDFRKYPIQTTVSGVTDTSLPPMNIPPPDYSAPPPGMIPVGPMGIGHPPMGPPMMNIPPPNMAGPPPGFLAGPPPIPADPYESFYPPGISGPPPTLRGPGYDNFGYGPPGSFGTSSGPPPPWESRDGYNASGWPYNQGPPRPGSEISSSDEEGSRNRHRDRSRRDYDRSRYKGTRSNERSRSREKDRERRHRDYDRERDHGDREREERHRSRRKRDDDDDHHTGRSKHKKSKHSKREKESAEKDESSNTQPEDQPT